MAFNLLDSVSGLFNKDLIGKAASSLGENEGGIQKALSGVIPSVLTGLLQKSSSIEGASSVLNMAKESNSGGLLGNISGLLGGGNLLNKGLEMVKGLFGDKASNVISMISGFAGIKESSASSLMSMAAPATLGTVGKHVEENKLGAGGLISMLASQKDNILNALPSGLNLAGALGVGSLGDIGNKLSGLASSVGSGVKKAAGGARWVLPLLLVIIAALLAWYFLFGGKNGCNQSKTSPEDTMTKTPVISPEKPAMPTESFRVKLPDGSELDALKGGIEDKLVSFLNDANTKGGKDVWFDFDNLNFETGSAKITAESQKQVNNLAAILKAFPKTKIKIGGYTDKTGDAAVNKKLSQSRADAVDAALKGAGANTSQLLGAEGYGAEFAKAAADAPEEERMKDRRIAISVREK